MMYLLYVWWFHIAQWNMLDIFYYEMWCYRDIMKGFFSKTSCPMARSHLKCIQYVPWQFYLLVKSTVFSYSWIHLEVSIFSWHATSYCHLHMTYHLCKQIYHTDMKYTRVIPCQPFQIAESLCADRPRFALFGNILCISIGKAWI